MSNPKPSDDKNGRPADDHEFPRDLAGVNECLSRPLHSHTPKDPPDYYSDQDKDDDG